MSPELELLSFLSPNARLDVKCTALEYFLGLTGSEDGKKWVKSISNTDIFVKLLNLLNDPNEIISKNAHLVFVNLSADQEIAEHLLKCVSQFLCYLQDPQWKHTDKLCTVLSNVSRGKKGAHFLFKILTDTDTDKEVTSSITLYQIVDIFNQWRSYNEHANMHHLAGVFLNLSQIREARLLFLDKSKCILPKLLPYTHFTNSSIRRGAIAGLIKNLCFEVGQSCYIATQLYSECSYLLLSLDYHEWLLSEEVDLLPHLLLPLAGPEQFEEQETEKLPEDLQYLPDDKQREPDRDIRTMLLEAMLKVECFSACRGVSNLYFSLL